VWFVGDKKYFALLISSSNSHTYEPLAQQVGQQHTTNISTSHFLRPLAYPKGDPLHSLEKFRFSCYIYLMIIAQTFDIPASRQVHLDFKVPVTVPAGKAKIEVIVTPIPNPEDADLLYKSEFENGGECPLCAKYNHEPNEETIAAIEEGRAMMRGEIPSPTFHSLEELLADLRS
jgi:hypothetical protein